MTLTRDELFGSPDHYLQSFDGDAAVFVPMDRAAYHRSIFLDGRISPASNRSMRIPLAVLAAPRPSMQPINWVFHIAHCGSTLLARALDRGDSNLVLREPFALRQLGVNPDADRLALALAMTGKRYCADRPTIVKANVPVNFLLPDIVAADGNARALFLHCSLRDYLLAVLRSDDHRKWVRGVTAQLARRLGDLSALSDAECAAALWRAQMQAFRRAMDALPQAGSLDCEIFFAQPDPVLRAAAPLLHVEMTAADVARTVSGPLFATNAKNPTQSFDNATRLGRRAGLEKALEPEIDQAHRWIEQAGGSIKLDRPLL